MQKVWNDHSLPIGLDHRSVHCVVEVVTKSGPKRRRPQHLKGWEPNDDGGFQVHLQQKVAARAHVSFEDAEKMLHEAGRRHGKTASMRFRFKPTSELRHLRAQRRATGDPRERQALSYIIRRTHRREVRAWKLQRLNRHLGDSSNWRSLRTLKPGVQGRSRQQQPPTDDFADMLESLFKGPSEDPARPAELSEQPFTMQELRRGIERMRNNRSGDEAGLVAELVKDIPAEFRQVLLDLYNGTLQSGDVPSSWRHTLFTMLAKTPSARAVTDFRPIANIRLFYKLFAYMLLGRIEGILDEAQPEEQHGFRGGHRIEEHLLTANVFIEKSLAAQMPI